MADKNMNAKITVEFDEAASRQSLNSGDSIKTLFGKIKKVISDLKAVAFSGSYTDLKDRPTDILTGGSQTATSDADGGINAFTFTKADGTTAEFVVKNGSKGDPGRDGVNATTTEIATPTASGLMDAAMVAKLNGIAEGANVVTHTSQLVNDSGYITAASIPTSLPASGGNADTVDGVHIAVADDAVAGSAWLAAFSDSNRISAVNPSRAYVGNAGNADTVDGLHGWYLGTLAQDGSSHGTSFPMFCQYNAWGDGRFGMLVSGYETRVHYATSADYAASSGSAASAGSAGSATYAYYAGNADPETVSLKNMSVGTAAANASNCPSGAWYGQYT